LGLIVNYKQDDIHYIAAVVMSYTGGVLAPIGSYISQDLSEKLLMLRFSILMILRGAWCLLKATILSSSQKAGCKSIGSR
ncbi:sulfite exporter TauE/SafE family protein, partial [Francisella tularensis subsp. holarctica]|nr:sulfite exporter TauE/SafE family protein [Francisella tularensis subsp. holarctica]